MAVLILLVLGILIMSILLVAIGTYLERRDSLLRQRESIEVRKRAMETKQRLDAEAFTAAHRIQDAIRRHGEQS